MFLIFIILKVIKIFPSRYGFLREKIPPEKKKYKLIHISDIWNMVFFIYFYVSLIISKMRIWQENERILPEIFNLRLIWTLMPISWIFQLFWFCDNIWWAISGIFLARWFLNLYFLRFCAITFNFLHGNYGQLKFRFLKSPPWFFPCIKGGVAQVFIGQIRLADPNIHIVIAQIWTNYKLCLTCLSSVPIAVW